MLLFNIQKYIFGFESLPVIAIHIRFLRMISEKEVCNPEFTTGDCITSAKLKVQSKVIP